MPTLQTASTTRHISHSKEFMDYFLNFTSFLYLQTSELVFIKHCHYWSSIGFLVIFTKFSTKQDGFGLCLQIKYSYTSLHMVLFE